jgi:cytochrome c biogenesis protein CcmG, thiol:disulfide interchange protein DsbE
MILSRTVPVSCFLGAVTIATLGGALGCSGGAEAGGEAASPGGAAHALVGKPAPDFTAEKVTGEGPASLKEANGKVVIVDFWATYCAPCKKSFPKYQELVDQFGGDLAVIAVSVDDKDDVTKEQIEEFAKNTGVKFAIVWDKEKTAAGVYSPPKMPSSFLIDKTGTVRHLHAGYESGEEAQIAEEIKALLK